jgi:hypothetical protein
VQQHRNGDDQGKDDKRSHGNGSLSRRGTRRSSTSVTRLSTRRSPSVREPTGAGLAANAGPPRRNRRPVVAAIDL